MKRLSIIIGALAFTSSIFAQKQWSLKECINYALEHNITIKQREINTKINKSELSTQINSRLPDLSASANESFNFGRSLSADNTYINRNTQSTSLGINTNVPLFTGLRIPNQIALSKLNLEASICDLDKAREDVSLQITQYYLSALYARDALKVAQAQTKLSKEQEERIKKRYEADKVALPDVAEAHSAYAQDEYAEVKAQNDYIASLLELTQLMELPSYKDFYLVDNQDEDLITLPSSPEYVYEKSLGIRPSIKAETMRLQGSEHSVKIAKSAYYPTLSLGAGISTGYYKTSGMQTESLGKQLDYNLNKSIGLSLSIPLFNRLSTRNSVRQAKLNRDLQELQLETAKKTLFKEIQQAFCNAENAQKQYESSIIAQEAADAAFMLVKKKYENEKATATEFNEAKQKRLKAQTDKLQAWYNYLFKSKIIAFYGGGDLD